MEQGSGLANNNVKVILNPRMKHNARKWLAESYPKIAFQCLSTKNTSVDSQEFQMNVKHNEDLKKFLTPMLQILEAAKVEKFRKRIKTCAQVLS